MEPLRQKRYRDKIAYITENLQILDVTPKNELEKRGLFYTIQSCIDCIMDLIAMALKDMGVEVSEDTTNIDKAIAVFKVNKKKAERLKLANGLRNILVHRYNGVEEAIVFNSLSDLKQDLIDWIEIIETFLSKVTRDG